MNEISNKESRNNDGRTESFIKKFMNKIPKIFGVFFIFSLVLIGSFIFTNKASAATLYWYGGSGNWLSATGHWSTNSGNSPAADHIAPIAADTVVFDANSNATAYTVTIDTAAVAKSATIGAPASGTLTITTDADKTRSLTLSGNATITGTPNIGGNSSINRLLLKSSNIGVPIVITGVDLPVYSNIDMQNIAYVNSQIVCMGDSITFGYGSTTYYYPSKLNELLGASGAYWVVNKGITGNTTSQMVARFTSDVLNVPNVKQVIILGGINDINNGIPTATIKANLQSMYSSAKSVGLNVIALTILPDGQSSSWNSTRQSNLEDVNNWILHNATDVDSRIDTYSALQDPSHATYVIPAYDYDHLHLNDAGYIALATYVYNNMSFVPSSPVNLSSIPGLSGDAGWNRGIIFTSPLSLYWTHSNDATSHNWSDSTYWKLSDHSTSGRVPLPQDSAIFNAGSFSHIGATVVQDMPRIPNMDFTGATNSPTFTPSTAATVFGGITLIPAMSLTNSANVYLIQGRGSYGLTSAGHVWGNSFNFIAPGGTLNIQDSLSSYSIGASAGTFNLNGNTITVAAFSVVGLQSISWNIGLILNFNASNSLINITGTVNTFGATAYSSIDFTRSTIKFTNNSSTWKVFDGGSGIYNIIWFSPGSGTGDFRIIGSNTFNQLKDDGTAAHSIKFTKGTTQTIADWQVGTASSRGGNTNVISLDTVDGAGTFNLIKTGTGYASSDYLSINRSSVTPASTWYAGLNSTNGASNTGWTFTAPDITAPTVTAFGIPSTSNSLTVSITIPFTATDNVSVTGYLVNESPTTPSVSGAAWSDTAQTQYVFSSEGAKTLYAWAKDANGNISSSIPASVTVDVTGPTGTISNGNGSQTNSVTPTLNLTIADAGVGITGAQMQFSCDGTNWSTWESYVASKTNFNVRTGEGCTDVDGLKTVYVEYKDSLGNIGNSLTANFTYISPIVSHSSGGSSVSSRFNNLVAMGNLQAAEDLKKEFPNQFSSQIISPSLSTPITITKTLKLTISKIANEEVKTLQTYLNSHGYNSGIPDGKFGLKTKNAVVKFQLANKLKGDGIVGPRTREMMK